MRALQAELTLQATGPGAGRLRVWMQAFPPAERDLAVQQEFGPLGLLDAESPYVDADPELAGVLREGLEAGRQSLEDALTHGASPEVNGWKLTYHVFDDNLDFFEVGALDEPGWKLGDSEVRYVERALAARAGLWGNHGYEAAYAMTWDDGDGDPLDGTQSYRLRFESTPPVGAFWSVTMYDLPEFFLVANPIGRCSIGDRTPGLVHADDGSLTIVLQLHEPSACRPGELASHAARRVPPDPPHVRARGRRLRRLVRAAADHARRIARRKIRCLRHLPRGRVDRRSAPDVRWSQDAVPSRRERGQGM